MKYYKKQGESMHEVESITSKHGKLTDEEMAQRGYLPFESKEDASAHYGVEITDTIKNKTRKH
jgi:hypothetical protein